MRRPAVQFALAWISSLVYLYAVYSPAASIPYAHHDQYRYFAEDHHQTEAFKSARANDSQWNWLWSIGRPVAAELEYQIFKRVHDIRDLGPVRTFGIGLAATAMTVLFLHLRCLCQPPVIAFCISGAIYTLPAMQFSVFMASYNHPVAQILAFLSIFVIRFARVPLLPCRGIAARCRTAACYCAAICLLVVAHMSYAPSAFAALLPVCGEIVLRGTTRWTITRRHFIQDTCAVAASCVVYLLIAKAYSSTHGAVAAAYYKLEVNGNLLGRLHTFVADVGISLLNLWNVLYGAKVFALAILGLLVGAACLTLVFQIKDSRGPATRRQRFLLWLQMISALVFLLFLSDTTYLAAPTSLSLYRMHFASSAMLLLWVMGACLYCGRFLSASSRRASAIALAIVFSIGSGLYAHWSVLMNCLNSQMELSFVASQIATHASERIARIHVIKPDFRATSYNGLPIVPGDEFNVPSTRYDQDIPWLVRAALCTVFDRRSVTVKPVSHTPSEVASEDDPTVIRVSCSATDAPIVPSPKTIIINMNHLLMLGEPTKPPLPGAPPATTENHH